MTSSTIAGGAAGLRHAGHGGGRRAAPIVPSRMIATARPACSASTGRQPHRPAHRGQRAERQHGRAGGQRGGAGERDHAVRADQDPGRRDRVDREQRGHGREGGAEQDGAAVAWPALRPWSARSRRRRRRARRTRRARSGRRRGDVRLAPADVVQQRGNARPPMRSEREDSSWCVPLLHHSRPYRQISARCAVRASTAWPRAPRVTGSGCSPASSTASLRASAARITLAPATRSGSGGTIFGGGSIHAQRAAGVGAAERQRGERAAGEVRRPDAVAGVAERRPRAAALERDDGRQVGGGDVDRPAPGVLDPAALEHREDPQHPAVGLARPRRGRAPRARACARPPPSGRRPSRAGCARRGWCGSSAAARGRR